MADLDRNGSDRNPPPTTTISTIAVQSGNTKIVIALLQSREWLELKVVELTPLLTLLGSTLQEASELQKAHDEVLLKIQSKQSPVEELLSQADQLIANQKNKGQVYVAMADSLAAAWKDINNLLQKRKEILNLNVRYHSNATMCLERTRALELACRGAPLPVEVPSIKELLARLSEVKRAMLESLMTTLQDGRALVDMLRETALEGTLDSRPAQIKSVTECAISQVEHWMEELHDRRRLLELSWQERKTQLEQCLALALLTADLKILEEIISDRSESLSRSNDQLGDSEASSQLLLYEHKKLLPEAKDFQEQALKILSATEHFSATGHFAGDEATAQAYRLLNNTSEYLEAIENRSNILEMTITFFRSAQIALTKLDQIEVQLLVSDLPTSSTQLTSYHSSLSKSIEEITEVPIEEGYKLLTSVPGAEGVKRILDEIENRKLQLSLKCTAHKEDNIQLIQSLNSFNESQKQLCLWLENSADMFLQGHQDMGSVLVMAKDFLQIHLQFLSDLQIKGTEINSLISVLPPVINTLDKSVRIDIESKVENLRSHWKKLKQYVEKRTELATAYVKFHTLAVDLANIFDNLESEMKKVNQEETLVRQTEEQWHEAQQVFVQLNNVGNNFREDTKNVGEPYLDAERARLCVDTLLEHFGDRKLSLESCWKAWENNLARQKACRVQWEVNMTETTQTVGWITKLDAELYPVLSEDEHVLGVILHDVENKLSSVLPEIKRAQTEIHCRIATAESLVTHGEVVANDEEILMQLRNLEQHVQSVGTNYQILIEMLVAFFKNLIQLERTIDSLKKQYGKMEFPSTVADVEKALREHDASRQAIQELFKFTHVESQQIIEKIKQQEPELAMEKDVNVLRGLLEDKRCDWERAWSDHKINLEQHLQLCHFDADLAQIHNNFDELDKQLAAVKGQYGESLGANKSTSIAFTYFEKTVEILRQRIETFINAGEVMLKSKHASSIHIEEGLHSIHKRWEEFSSHVSHTRNLIDISIQYFTLIEEAEEWFKECSRLLVGIARRSASVHKPEEATHLLEELENFFKSGEIKQDERIIKISELATKLYGVHDSSELHQVKSERKEMFESFSQVSRELRTLVGTLNRPSEPVKMEIDDIKSTNNKMHTVSTTETVSSSVQEKIIIIHEDSLPQTSSTFEERVLKSPSPPAKKAKFQSESKEQKAPFFTVPLADAIIEEGNKLIFECKVAGVPTPQISWMKDGISIDNNLDYHTLFNDGICSLTIEETFAEDSAKFTCHAINEAGFAETTATLSVRECEGETPPSFVTPLRPAKVKERSQFAFMCRVAGNPLPTVQWCKDTTCIDNSSDYVITYNNGEAVLKFDEITLNDQAEYFCKATNRLGTESTSAMLTVEGKEKIEVPVFTVPLSNIMARAGQKIKLECEVHGTPEPQITWLHNGKIIKETHDLKISYDQHNAVLVITEAFPKDAGTYEVKAVNCAGENVSTCHVSVKGRLPTETSDSEIASDMEPCKPVIQVSLKDLTVFEGMKARLDCVIVGQPEPEVIWYLENRPVKESGDFQLLFHGDRCSLIIKEAYIEDAGEYKVVAINSAGEASSSCRLTVQSNTSEVCTKQSAEESQKPETELSKPHFTMLLSDVLVTEGDTVHLKCIVKGEPVPSVTWCLNNIDIVCSDRIQCKQESDGTCSLTINHVLPSDKGVYTAKAINSVGEAKCFSQLIVKLSINTENTNPIDVHVAERKPVSPIFTELFADRTVTEGTTTKFECVVTAKPTPKIHWLFNEKPVSGKDFLISTSGPRQVLTIQNVMKSHAGRIACVAENEAGKATCLATLSVRDVPVDSLLPSLASIDLSETTSFEMKRSVFMKSVTQSEVVTAGNGKEPTIQIHGLSSCTEQAMQRIGDSPSAQVQIHKTREYHNVGGVEDKVDQQFQTSNIPISEVKLPTKDISRRKEVAPRFITPIMGKIVNQHEDVILEATIESYPTAEIKWTKNGRQLCMTDNAAQSWELNRARLEIKNIRLEDAGKYTCTASSTVGTASSTADVVVKKSVFPPVIGKRLQSSIHEVGQRVVLEVEITGIPEPTVTWYKDEQQIASKSSEYRVLNQGSSYSVIINEAGHAHSGKYCVKATNCGGEALSTADLVIVEPQQTTLKHLETMELTVTPQPLVKSKPLLTADAHEFSLSSDKSVLSSNITKVDKTVSVHLEQSSHTYQQLSDISLTYPQQRTEISVTPSAGLESYIEPISKQESFTESISKKELYTEPVANNESRTETTEQKETVTNKDTYVKPFVMKDSLVTQFSNEDNLKESKEYKESNIEDSSITKKHALEYFKNIIKENDEEKLTSKQFEKSTSKTAFNIQDCQFTPQTHLTSLPSENSITNSTYQPDYKYQVNEDIFNKQQAENRSSVEKNIFDLQPEPPPEIGYIPKTLSKPKEDLAERVKKLEDSHRTLSAIEIPSGAVKIFPTPVKKESESAVIYENAVSTNNNDSGIREIRDIFSSNENSKDHYTHFSQKLDAATNFPKEVSISDISALRDKQSILEDTESGVQWTSHETYKSLKCLDTSDITSVKTIPIFSQSDISCENKQKTPLPPSAEGVAMEKLWSRTIEHPRSHSVNLPVARSTSPMPSAEGVAMDKLWGHKQSNIKRIWPPPKPAEEKNLAPWVIKPSSEISWPPSQIQQASISQGGITKSTENTILASNKSFVHFTKEVEISEMKKVFPPEQNRETVILSQPKPLSKEDTKFEDFNLEPGPPPEIGYARPPLERRQSLVETIEQDLEKDLDKAPSRHLVGAVRIMPPPPKKKEKSSDQVVPQKYSESKFTEFKTHSLKESKIESILQSFQKCSNVQSETICKSKSTLPPRPSKFMKGSFTESDYESDYESSKIASKWAAIHTSRPHSVMGHDDKVPESPAPSAVFLKPVSCSLQSTKESVQTNINIKTEEYFSRTSKHSQITAAATVLKPGSPPEFIQPTPLTKSIEGTEKVKPGSPKSKSKISCESGYMADTDEPQTLHKEEKTLTKSEDSRIATMQHGLIKSEKKNLTGKALAGHPVIRSSFKKETTSQQKINQDCAETQLTSFPFKPEGLFQTKRHLGPPPPSPSKFIKGEFRESDYESDYESRIPPIWRPYESDTELTFRPVRPLLTPVSGRSQNIGRTPTPPTEFDEPPQFSGPPRPKFEPIEKPLPTVKIDAQSQRSLKVIRPKPLPAQTSPIETIIATPAIKHDSDIILKPGSPPKIDFAPPPVSYRVPGGTQLETSNTMSFAESTGSSRRIVSMQQTTRVIKFEDEHDKKVVKQSEWQKRENAPTPTKFVAGKARESDYESDFEGTKIKPVWVPESSMKNSLQVQAEQRRLQRVEEMRKRFGETTTEMKCMSEDSNEPCQFGTSSGGTSQVANYAASKHFSEMTHSFKSKAQQFASDLMTDVKSNKDMVENKALQKEGMLNGNDPQSYREESKVSEYGTKHIDPDTGLIYFKYDFGYEFGVILPGEEKSSKKKSQVLDKKEEGNIDFPVIHEKTVPKKSSREMKTVKWEQTSESEMSDIEGESRRKRQIQHEPHISVQLGTPSPQSLSPSIQSLSPYSAGYDSTVSPHVSWKDISSPPPVSQMPVTAAGFDSVHKPPFFITPLRDIACVIGQPARFECIVQAEPVPDIMWSKDKHMLHPSPQYTTEYRNGVCRLSLHQTMPYDAGKYMCTATNIVGIAVTESTLQVAGERRSVCK